MLSDYLWIISFFHWKPSLAPYYTWNETETPWCGWLIHTISDPCQHYWPHLALLLLFSVHSDLLPLFLIMLVTASDLWLLFSVSATLFWVIFVAAAAKSLQSCPTLCDPIDGSPLGSSVPGILQARILEWVAISFANAWKWKVKVKSLSHAGLLATPWQATRLLCPWDFPGKSTGVGCHCGWFLTIQVLIQIVLLWRGLSCLKESLCKVTPCNLLLPKFAFVSLPGFLLFWL